MSLVPAQTGKVDPYVQRQIEELHTRRTRQAHEYISTCQRAADEHADVLAKVEEAQATLARGRQEATTLAEERRDTAIRTAKQQYDAVVTRLESASVPMECQLRSAAKVASASYHEVLAANHMLQERMCEDDPKRFISGFDGLLRQVDSALERAAHVPAVPDCSRVPMQLTAIAVTDHVTDPNARATRAQRATTAVEEENAVLRKLLAECYQEMKGVHQLIAACPVASESGSGPVKAWYDAVRVQTTGRHTVPRDTSTYPL